ncbi:hypothetical protein NPIL_64491 [Nephila pilipes]|uniref:Uncharacterized protein n=1 Tax=Nephila pilipes TaxID=299642 RepID=A0A8X6NBH7_NEPPI|nr:hypothetical protein NPIL_64491 [Nephila pilipes]
MGDEAHQNQETLVNEILDCENTEQISLPTNSFDMSMIENLWDDIGISFALRHPPSRETKAAKTTLLEEWNLSSQTVVV